MFVPKSQGSLFGVDDGKSHQQDWYHHHFTLVPQQFFEIWGRRKQITKASSCTQPPSFWFSHIYHKTPKTWTVTAFGQGCWTGQFDWNLLINMGSLSILSTGIHGDSFVTLANKWKWKWYKSYHFATFHPQRHDDKTPRMRPAVGLGALFERPTGWYGIDLIVQTACQGFVEQAEGYPPIINRWRMLPSTSHDHQRTQCLSLLLCKSAILDRDERRMPKGWMTKPNHCPSKLPWSICCMKESISGRCSLIYPENLATRWC